MREVSPRMVGAFVIGAVAIGLTAAVIFGTGRLFEERGKAVAFFSDSIAGLRVGAPVEFRGIPVGAVTDIWIEFDPETLAYVAPVVFEFEIEKFRGLKEARGAVREALIERGLRAQLSVQSFVTGQQTIQLGFFPDSPAQLVETDLPYDQVPTVPARIEEFQRTLDQVGDEAIVFLNSMGKLLSAENRELIHETLQNVAKITAELELTSKSVGELIDQGRIAVHEASARTSRIPELIDNANAAVLSYKVLADHADATLSENRDTIKEAIVGLRKAETSIERLGDGGARLLAENRRGISDFTNSGLYEITNLAVEAQAAVEQFRRVLEEMGRDPARFFLGEPGEVEVR